MANGQDHKAGVACGTRRRRTWGSAAWLLAGVLTLSACGKADFTYADGTRGDFEDWRGSWVFINYWAEWCAPCRHEIPELNALHDAHNGAGALVVGVNYDGIRDSELDALIERMEITFPVLVADPHSDLAFDRPSRLPTTFVINPDGEIVEALEGPQTRADLERAAQLVSNEAPAALEAPAAHEASELP